MATYALDANIIRPTFLGGDIWQLSAFNEVTIPFGKNGSVKSLLLRGLRNTDPEAIHNVVPERMGSSNFEAILLAQQMNSSQRRL